MSPTAPVIQTKSEASALDLPPSADCRESQLVVEAMLRPPLSTNGATSGPDLTVVVPTFNERANVPLLIERLAKSLPEATWEVIFVDDNSPDGTGQFAKALGRSDNRVRCISRIGRRGLAGAAIEGILAAQGRYIAVMDGDLQHDEMLLAEMLRILRSDEADLVIGSRYVSGDVPDGLSPNRQMASRVAGLAAKWVLGVQVADPMSGFFMMPSATILSIAEKLWTNGFKLLMDILATTKGQIRVREIPYSFRARVHGTSKLDSNVVFDFFALLVTKRTGNFLPPRFVGFVLVGAIGVLVHLAVLAVLIHLKMHFALAQAIATLVAMTNNFLLDNALTYSDQRLRGFRAVRGLFVFYLICGLGALSNIGVASWIYASLPVWWVAGLFGSIIGAFWNYTLSSTAVWRSSSF